MGAGFVLVLWFYATTSLPKLLSDHLVTLGWREVAGNLAVVYTLLALLGLGLGLVLRGRVGLAAAFALFYTINVLNLKNGLLKDFFELPMGARAALCWLFAALGILLYLRLRKTLETTLLPWLRSHQRKLVAGFGALLAVLWAAQVEAPRVPPATDPALPNVVVVTFDSLSARHMSVYGYERPTTPNLEKFAQDSLVFDAFHANYNTTKKALRALQGWRRKSARAGLTERLAEAGYTRRVLVSYRSTAYYGLDDFNESVVVFAFEKNPLYRALRRVMPRQKLVWLAQLGSQEWIYYWPYHPFAHLNSRWRTDHSPADLCLEAALDVLRESPRGTLVWVHLWLPHYPYVPDKPWLGQFGGGPLPEFPVREDQGSVVLDPTGERGIEAPEYGFLEPEQARDLVKRYQDLYDEYVLMGDAYFGKFAEGLKAIGQYDQDLLVVSSDHGEAFRQGLWGHGWYTLYEEVLHVPMLMRLPGGRLQGQHVRSPAEQVDFAPTVLAALGLPLETDPPRDQPGGLALPFERPRARQGWSGESMLPYAGNGRMSDRPKFSFARLVFSAHKAGDVVVFWHQYKLVRAFENAKRYQLFDLSQDPEEKRDLSREKPDVTAMMLELVRRRTEQRPTKPDLEEDPGP